MEDLVEEVWEPLLHRRLVAPAARVLQLVLAQPRGQHQLVQSQPLERQQHYKSYRFIGNIWHFTFIFNQINEKLVE